MQPLVLHSEEYFKWQRVVIQAKYVSSQLEFLDHRLALKAEEEVVCRQGRHGVPSRVGGAGNMW